MDHIASYSLDVCSVTFLGTFSWQGNALSQFLHVGFLFPWGFLGDTLCCKCQSPIIGTYNRGWSATRCPTAPRLSHLFLLAQHTGEGLVGENAALPWYMWDLIIILVISAPMLSWGSSMSHEWEALYSTHYTVNWELHSDFKPTSGSSSSLHLPNSWVPNCLLSVLALP